MMGHSENPSTELTDKGDAARADESNTRPSARLSGRLRYWWSLAVAGALLLVVGTPVILVSWLARRRHWVYPAAQWGGRTWLRLSGARVRVRGHEHLDPARSYVFIANHRS